MKRLSGLALVVAAALALAMHWAIGARDFQGWALSLGSITFPLPRLGAFLLSWITFGSVAAVLATLGLTRLAGPGLARAFDRFAAYPTRRFVPLAAFVAFATAMLARTWLLHGVPLTDDEGAYRFMAQVLAGGHLTAPSPPMKLFFDRGMMINDGRFYALYFLGWPALLAPWVLVHAGGLANAVYSALTVPALYLLARRVAGRGWAKVTVLLFGVSPMIAIGAAALGSHPSELMLLAWLAWLAFRSAEAEAPLWAHAGVAVAFGAAVFDRPLTAMGLGLPFLVVWALGLRRLTGKRRLAAAASFAGPAVLLAGAFFAVNLIQNGSPLTLGYQRYYAYARANGFRFSLWHQAIPGGHPGFRFGDLAGGTASTAAGLLRFSVAFLGWPCSLVFAFFAGRTRETEVYWASAGTFVAALLLTSNAGIDTYGPVHLAELALPVLVLSAAGLERLDGWLTRQNPGLVLSAVLGLVGVTAVGYLPVRLGAVASIADQIAAPYQAVDGVRHGQKVVVFASHPFVRYCHGPSGFVFFLPTNDPGLTNPVIWANNLGPRKDETLMARFPGREGWILGWDHCTPRIVSLERARARHRTDSLPCPRRFHRRLPSCPAPRSSSPAAPATSAPSSCPSSSTPATGSPSSTPSSSAGSPWPRWPIARASSWWPGTSGTPPPSTPSSPGASTGSSTSPPSPTTPAPTSTPSSPGRSTTTPPGT